MTEDVLSAPIPLLAADRPVICVTQARMNSGRLPGKVMRTVLGKPLLWWHLTRLQRASLVDQIVVATTPEPEADQIAGLAGDLGIPVVRGSEHDVLSRFALAASVSGAKTIIRVTSDCPLIDPGLIDGLIRHYAGYRPEIAYSGILIQRLARGIDAEIMSRSALDEANERASLPGDREHVTPYLVRQSQKSPFPGYEPIMLPQAYRLCVDEAADLELVTRIIETLAPENPGFGIQDIIALLAGRPDLVAINGAVRQRHG